jgi:histidinol-phosphate aminotransferase
MILNNLLRKNIVNLKPYSSARDEYTGEAMVFLDANENPFNEPYNRYPDPLQRQLKVRIGEIKGVDPVSIFLGNGSDEPIDLLIRAFCEPGIHNIVQIEPTYGMYQVAAAINNIEVISVPLKAGYRLDAKSLLAAVNERTRIIFLCSPNNPTGNLLDAGEMLKVIQGFDGPVVIDEAYIDFAPDQSFLPAMSRFSNLIVLQTFSKAWGMAGIRLGMAFAQREVVAVLNKIKYPYNLNILTQQKAMELLERPAEMGEWVKVLLAGREELADRLNGLSYVQKVWPSDANFILVKMKNARKVYDFLTARGIIVRDRSKVVLCEGSLRITVGNPEENRILLETLSLYDTFSED